jgi:putative transposase
MPIGGMPRKPRAEYESGIYHVYSRGNRRQPIYVDDTDRLRYLRTVGRVVRLMDWSCLAYCLMGNHMHLLVETRTPNLGRGMHRLHGPYAQYFNRRYGHVGHLFQDRFGADRIENDLHLWTVATYIARNPVEAQLCREPADWPWASHAAIVHGTPPLWLDTTRLFAFFGDNGNGRRRYLGLVDALSLLRKGDSPL